MELSKYIACICEGTAEEVIVSKLLDADLLIFTKEDLLDGELIRTRGGESFERRYLKRGYTGKITVLRVLDSRRERFVLSNAYKDKIDVVNGGNNESGFGKGFENGFAGSGRVCFAEQGRQADCGCTTVHGYVVRHVAVAQYGRAAVPDLSIYALCAA